MNKMESMMARKAILDWRGRWTKNICESLQQDSSELKKMLDAKIDAMSFKEAILSKLFVRKTLQPIFVSWSENKAQELISAAQTDLLTTCEQSLHFKGASCALDENSSLEDIKDIAGASLSSAMAVAAIPTVVTFSTATVSAGGFLGLIGMTTSVIVMPYLILGICSLLLLFHLAGSRIQKIKTNRQVRLKEQMQGQIYKKILYGAKHKSLTLSLTEAVDETANKLIGELKNVR